MDYQVLKSRDLPRLLAKIHLLDLSYQQSAHKIPSVLKLKLILVILDTNPWYSIEIMTIP